eukprot:662892-Pleurochrysis_carterae.AAC.1
MPKTKRTKPEEDDSDGAGGDGDGDGGCEDSKKPTPTELTADVDVPVATKLILFRTLWVHTSKPISAEEKLQREQAYSDNIAVTFSGSRVYCPFRQLSLPPGPCTGVVFNVNYIKVMVAFDDLKWAAYDLLNYVRLGPIALDFKVAADEDVDSRRVSAALRAEGGNAALASSFLPA